MAEKLKLKNEQKRNIGDNKETKKKIDEIESKLSDLTAKKNRNKVMDNFRTLEGNFGTGLWKIKNKMFPKHQTSLPVAKKDVTGKLLTARNDIKKLYSDTFIFRLRERPFKKGYEEIEKLTKDLYEQRLKITKENKTPDWTMKDLDTALAKLKKNKARDPSGLANEIFMQNAAGKDLKNSLLLMFNKIKETEIIPEFATLKNISAIPKKGSDKTNLDSERGIIIGSVFNTILSNLLYNSKYETVDENMSDSNAGARKNKGTRIQNFIVGSAINEAVQTKTDLDVLVLDYKMCFDSLNTKTVISDLYESGIQDDHLNIINKADSSSHIGVKTPFGITERKTVENKVLQGECLGPLKCSNSIDTIGKKCLQTEENLHYYRDSVGLPPLGLVDDIIALAKCGTQSVKLNAYLNAQSNIKNLQLGVKKCHKLHVGKNISICPDLYVDNWKLKPKEDIITSIWDQEDSEDAPAKLETVPDEVYLGNVISFDAKQEKNVKKRVARGTAAGNAVLQMLNDICFGPYETEVFIELRNSLILSTLLSDSESWVGLTIKDVEELEKCDERIMKQKFELHSKSPTEAIYLELGLTPLRFLIMQRRLLFLNFILNEPPDTLIHQVLQAQIKKEYKNDWIKQVKQDMTELEINLTYDQIKQASKNEFKKFVKETIKKKAFEFLMKKKGTHSKMNELQYNELKLQSYLKPNMKLTSSETNFALSLRMRMLRVKDNFKTAYPADQLQCRLCKDNTSVEDQRHLLHCTSINGNSLSLQNATNYEDLFSGDGTKTVEVIRRMKVCYNQFQKLSNFPCDPVYPVVNSVSASLSDIRGSE